MKHPFRILSLTLVFGIATLTCNVASADFIVDFFNGDTFDGDTASGMADSTDQAGPFEVKPSVNGTLTTRLINGMTFDDEANNLETTAGKLGIDSAGVSGGEKNNWDDGESWTYFWDVDTYFGGIHFGGFSSGETFMVQSDSFIGFVPAGPLGSGVSFDSVSGTWTFDGSASNDDFAVGDLGGTAAEVAAFDDITISYSGSSPATLQAFNTIPEPRTAILLGGLLLAGVLIRRKTKA